MTSITPTTHVHEYGSPPPPDPGPPSGSGCCCMAVTQASGGVDQLGTSGGDAYPPADKAPSYAPVDTPPPSSAAATNPADGVPGFPTGPTGVSEADQQRAREAGVSAQGLVPQAKRNLERAFQWGLKLNGGVGTWNEWHADGSSVDVSNYAGGGVGSETPEMRAYADEMVALGRAGVKGPDGGLLVTHVVYAGMKAGASTGWKWTPVSQPNDITQGHWDHVHVETDSWV